MNITFELKTDLR